MLKLAYNDIPRRSVTTTCTSEDASYAHKNLFYGGSSIYWQSAAAVTSATIQLNLDGASAGRSIDHIILRGLNLITSQASCGVEVRASTDNFATSDVQIFVDASVSTADLVGPHSEDFIITGTASALYKNFKIIITTGSAKFYRLRKIFLGTFFDFDGRSPKYPYDANFNQSGDGFSSDSGSVFMTSRGRKRKEYIFTWSAVTDTLRNTFDNDVGAYLEDYPVCLYTTAGFDHSPINGSTLLCAWASYKSTTHSRWKDVNQLQIRFIEDMTG